jgi:formyltetrahydrofolate deformylase
MRIEWDLQGFKLNREEIDKKFSAIAGEFNMSWNMYFSWETPKMAVFVSKLSHCIDDILARYNSGEWNVHIPLIISNHTGSSIFIIPFCQHFQVQSLIIQPMKEV